MAGAPVLTQTYSDPVGDAGTGADIANTTVSYSGGTLTFRIDIPNRPTWVSGEEVGLFFNTNGNQLDGDAGGEYRVSFFQSGADLFYSFERYNEATQQYDSVTSSNVSASFGTGVIEVSLRPTDLGNPQVFEIDVWSFLPTGVADAAPDSRGWYPPFDTRDSDSDAVSDTYDLCPTEAAGNYDPNHNGCAGPFDRVGRPVFRWEAIPVAGGLRFGLAVLDSVENGSKVVVRVGSRTQNSIKRAGRPLVVRIIVGRTLSYGTVIRVAITKPNEIGWYGQYRVTPNGLKRFGERCIPPGGGTPRGCGSIDRGE
jgi:hypothetical protein